MAVMWSVIAINDSTADILIEDLGIIIPASDQVTLSDQFTYERLSCSDDLRDLVALGSLTINDGSNDLSIANGGYWLTIENLKKLRDDYYSKTELQTSGQAAVHFDNITDVPPFGDYRWDTPVLARVLDINGTAPAGSEGDFYVDTDDNHLYKYISASWVDQGAPTNLDRVINLDSTSENIYQYSSGSGLWVDQGQTPDNTVVIITDDGDGKKAQYVYDLGLLSWKKIADLDSNSLDEAYDANGSGAGREIIVDSGSVKLNATSGTYSPIELTQQTVIPSSGLSAGQLSVVGGILYVYDGTRLKWLSVQRMFLAFGRRGGSKNQYLHFYGSELPSNKSGLRMVRNSTIVSLSGQFDVSGTGTFRIRKNDVASNITSLLLSTTIGNGDTTIDVNLTSGDYLQSYIENTVAVEDAMILVEIAWRP